MKNLLLGILIVIGLQNLYGQESIMMNWKLNKSDTLVYKTVMQQIDTNYVNYDFEDLFKSISDSTTEKESNEIKELYNDINKSIQNTQYETRMYIPKKDYIEIEMYSISEKTPVNNPDTFDIEVKEILESIQSMTEGVLLRGSINKNGTIHSFWIHQTQKNLIALLFELPGKQIKIGDTWSIAINLIGNNQNFICDSSYYKNEVKLIDIKKSKDETIAVLKYDIKEYVEGEFNALPIFGKKGDKKTIMYTGFQGIGEFSIEKGKWHSYDGIMFSESSGWMDSRQKIKYSLIEQ